MSLPCFAASLTAIQELDITAYCSGVAQSRLAARSVRCFVNSLSLRFSFLREFVASVLHCFVDLLLRCFAASLLCCLVPSSLLRCLVTSLLRCFVAPCFVASLLFEATSESPFEYTIRNRFSKSLVSVTLSSVALHSAPHYSVHVYARGHTSIYIYIYSGSQGPGTSCLPAR